MEGNFSTSTCYKELLSTEGFIEPWNHIWKQKLPQKVKIFLWQVAHGCLPTNELLFKRNIASESNCKGCGHVKEDLEHVLWHCTLAKKARLIL